MTKVLFIDDGIDFDAETARQKPIGGAETAFVSLELPGAWGSVFLSSTKGPSSATISSTDATGKTT